MNAAESIEAAADQHKQKNLIRSQYKDVMVKVDEDIYYLDRLQLALKSKYFEKLFTEDYSDKNSDLVELPLMDTDTFSAVVDMIYGEELKSVVNSDNFVSLLMAMDYLQMDIDPETYKSLANGQLGWSKPLHKDIFKLNYFIADDAKYEYLLPIVFQHLSGHLEKLQDRDEILSIKFDHIVKIISNREASSYITQFRTVSKLCARWICHDMENRLHLALNLVNAARFRFQISNKISHQDFNLELSSNKEHLNQNSISTYIHKLMMYCGEIRCPEAVNSEPVETTCARDECNDNENLCASDSGEDCRILFSREPKLESFLKNSNFYDITVQAGEKFYKLHRSVLKSESVYFEDLFSKEHSELAAQCKGIPPSPPSKDKIYSLDEIDSATFDMIVNHMYVLGKSRTYL
ncbi:uncharacterized protein LOC135847992 [Planococcus citri]|uniref:uncharacterized protein LOC135847992 n=1 Tax=Planococcus citri TaxID=170843 RepID=UPI0031F807F3